MKQTDIKQLLVEVGDALYHLRHLKKQKITSVSSDIGISHAVISRIENGRYNSLTLALLHKLAVYYDVPITSLFPNKTGLDQDIEALKSEIYFLKKTILAINKNSS